MEAPDLSIPIGSPSSTPSSNRAFSLVLAACAALAVGLRALALVRPGGAWHYRVDYDEGVYFGAASLLLEGLRPYRDFLFVHPPGWPAIIALTSAPLGPVDGFVLARWLAVGVGGLNVVMSGLIARRWMGPLAGVLAALLYAIYPEVVMVERGPFLEPALNLACLSMVWSADRGLSTGNHRWIALAGVAGAVALSIKVWAVLWLVGLAWALWPPPSRRVARLVAFALPLGAVLAAMVLPWAAAAPAAFFDQVVRFHLARPADGTFGAAERLGQIFAGRHLASPVLAAAAVAFWSLHSRQLGHVGRIILPTYLLTLVAFLTTKAYWPQYNAHLAASEVVLAGSVAAAVGRLTGVRWRGVALALVGVSGLVSVREVVIKTRRTHAIDRLAARVRGLEPDACVFAFEPSWTLAAGRVGHRTPPKQGPVMLDSYAAMLAVATSGGARSLDVEAAFASEQSQGEVRALLEGCEYVILGPRGRRQLSPATQLWISESFEPLPEGTPGDDELDLWRRRTESVTRDEP